LEFLRFSYKNVKNNNCEKNVIFEKFEICKFFQKNEIIHICEKNEKMKKIGIFRFSMQV